MSINNDIRVRSSNTGRIAALIATLAAISLAVAFGISLIPSSAHAQSFNFFHWGGYNVQHGQHFTVVHHEWQFHHGRHNGGHDGDDNDNDDNDTGTLNIVITVDNSNGTGAATVADFGANVYENGSATPVDGSPFINGDDVDLTNGASYNVQEVTQDGYDVSYSAGCTGTISDESDQTCTITNTDVPPVAAAACTTAPSSDSYVVNVTQSVTNDPDSGFFGNWALDAFTRHIQIWPNTDDTSGGVTYCAQADDAGTFVTTGPTSPNSNVALTAGIAGTMTGSTGLMTIKGTLSAQWPTTGEAPAQDCSVAGTNCDLGLTSKWVSNYFSAGVTNDYPNWGWTYNACGHGTWVNAAAGSTGDILSAGNDCVPPAPTCGDNQTLDTDTNTCVENAPAPSNDSGSNGGGNGGGGGAPLSGPLSIGFVNNGGSGGEVLGASTEAPLCSSAYLNSYLKKGMKGDQVTKLQQFLNANEGAGLTVNGIFDQATFDAVSAFQTKYSDEVLKPWFTKGLSKDMNPSGYVYKLTLYKINMIECASLNTPAPQLP